MSRMPIPLYTPDISAYARRLRAQLMTADAPPGHLELMNMLARAGEFRNFQHLRAATTAKARITSVAEDPPLDATLVERALRYFDAAGTMTEWPAPRQVKELCLWTFWSVLPRGDMLHEKQVNAILNDAHTFGDAALIRRELWGAGLVHRNRDGSDYQRQELAPCPEAKWLIREITSRRKASAQAGGLV